MKTGALIVAAGMSSRMGAFKPMMRLGGESLVRRVIATLKDAGADPVTLVTGYRAGELEAHVADMAPVCLRNENYETTQMFESAAIGLRFLADRCGRILFTPADVPLFSSATVRRLLESGSPLAVPVCGGRYGHPLLISAALIPDILDARPADGLRGALRRFRHQQETVCVEDEGILCDADTLEDFIKLQEYLRMKNA